MGSRKLRVYTLKDPHRILRVYTLKDPQRIHDTLCFPVEKVVEPMPLQGGMKAWQAIPHQ